MSHEQHRMKADNKWKENRNRMEMRVQEHRSARMLALSNKLTVSVKVTINFVTKFTFLIKDTSR